MRTTRGHYPTSDLARGIVAPVLWLVWFALGGVPAGEPSSDDPGLHWSAPAGCPGRAEFGRDVEALTGRPLLADDATVRVDGQITVAPDGYVLRLQIVTPHDSEHRALAAADCQTLARAAALVVAVAVDPVGAVDAIATAPIATEPTVAPVAPAPELPPKNPPPRTAPLSATSPPPQPRERVRGDHRLGLGASGGMGWGLAPALTGGIEADVHWLWRRIRVGAAGYHWFARTFGVDRDVSVTAATSGSWLRGCYALDAGPVELPFCGGLDIAAAHGGGTGARVSARRAADLFLGLNLGFGVDWIVRPRFVWRTRVDVLLSLRRPGIHLREGDEPREVYRMPLVGVRLVLGPQFRWP